jgi:hypothetical protein
VFRRILMANRGEVAARVTRTCRRLGVEVVAVVSDADADASWLRDAHAVVRIGPGPASRSYLDQDVLLEAALRHGCSAVHPGWGFLSENDRFCARVQAAGLTFVGPDPRPIRMMGDKRWRAHDGRARHARIPGTKEPLADVDAALRAADEVGYPVLLKAVAGGGGRGMRKVDAPSRWRARSPRPAPRRRPRSATAGCTSSGASSTAATSRCRSSPIATAACWCSASGSARCSGATRRCSRRRRRPGLSRPSGPGSCRWWPTSSGSGLRQRRHRRDAPRRARPRVVHGDEHPAAGRARRDGEITGSTSSSGSSGSRPASGCRPGRREGTGHALELRINAEDPDG